MKKDTNIFNLINLNSDLLKNTSVLVSGTIIAQIIPILLQPILRRYYSPEVFGAFAVYISIVGILIVVSSLKYELAIILPKNEKEAANIFFLSFIINLLFNIIVFIVVLFLKHEIADFLNLSSDFESYLFFVPVGTFFYNLYQSINYWLIRKKSFFAISKNKFIRRGFEGSAQVGFKFVNISKGLILGDIIGHFANVSFGLYQSVKRGLKFNYFSLLKIKYVFSKYSEYPKYNVIPSLLSASSYLLPAIFINKFFSSEYTGYFDLSKLVLSIPLALIATSVSNVLLEKISEQYRSNKSFIKEIIPVSILIFFIAVFEIVIIRSFGPEIFRIAFGSSWEYSGEISRILVWSYSFNFFIASFSSVFIAIRKIKILSVWQILYFTFILLLFLFKDFPFINFIKMYVIIEVISYSIFTILIIITIRNYTLNIKN